MVESKAQTTPDLLGVSICNATVEFGNLCTRVECLIANYLPLDDEGGEADNGQKPLYQQPEAVGEQLTLRIGHAATLLTVTPGLSCAPADGFALWFAGFAVRGMAGMALH